MITILEILFNVLAGVGLAVGYLAMGLHVAHRQFEIFVKAGQSREAALINSRHLIMDWALYLMIDGLRAIGKLIDGKISDVPLTDAEREVKIRELEIDTGIIDQAPVEKVSLGTALQERMDKLRREELALNRQVYRDEWISPAEYFDPLGVAGETRKIDPYDEIRFYTEEET